MLRVYEFKVRGLGFRAQDFPFIGPGFGLETATLDLGFGV